MQTKLIKVPAKSLVLSFSDDEKTFQLQDCNTGKNCPARTLHFLFLDDAITQFGAKARACFKQE